jgi:hypothetical protein
MTKILEQWNVCLQQTHTKGETYKHYVQDHEQFWRRHTKIFAQWNVCSQQSHTIVET